jgi:hypothetical protein
MQFEHEVEREKHEQAVKEVVEAYERLFARTDAGIVLHDLCEYARVFVPTFCAGAHDLTAHEEGMRRVVLRILRLSGIEMKMREQLGVRIPVETKGA